jgi:hypothetical protein
MKPTAATTINPNAGTAYRKTIGEKKLARNFLIPEGTGSVTVSLAATTGTDALS